MDNGSIAGRVMHLREVEKLSQRQIAQALGINRKRVVRILKRKGMETQREQKDSILEPYRGLISEWYSEHPKLQAAQIYERLLQYGYDGSYPTVARFSRTFRAVRPAACHQLHFLPGEEAQVDWFFFTHERVGPVAGFLYVLAYSRYAWGMFYRRTSFEFFLDGHIRCFTHLRGAAHRHRYDNIKSVVIKRSPVIQYNPQFLDFATFYRFSIHLCNPYKGNEKGRVERPIRDIRGFLYGEDFADMDDLNRRFHAWLDAGNDTRHRVTGKTPRSMLAEERLLSLPQLAYNPARVVTVLISKTALVEFDTNFYSVPDTCAGKAATIFAYPDRVEIHVGAQRVAAHTRCFGRKQTVHNPLHSERLLDRTPRFKRERILQLIRNMNPEFACFVANQDDDDERADAAYQLFVLLKSYSRALLASAVRELNQMRTFKIKALLSMLNLPQPKAGDPVWPQNEHLLNMDYQPRRLEDYDIIG